MLSSKKRIKAFSTPNSEGGKKKKEKTPEQLELQRLRDKRKKIAEGCRSQHQSLDAQIQAFYVRNPQYKPQARQKPNRSDAEINCSDPRFANCKVTVYDYPNQDRRTITWEKVPRPQKIKVPKEPRTPKHQYPKKFNASKHQANSDALHDGYGCQCGW